MNDLTHEAVNEYFDVIHSIDNSLYKINCTLSDLADSMTRIADILDSLTQNHCNLKGGELS